MDFNRLFCCYYGWTVPRGFLMTLTTAKRGSLCCASFKLSAHDGFSFTSALQCQRREMFVLHPALTMGNCLLLPACGCLHLVTSVDWAHPLNRRKAEFCWRQCLICAARGNSCGAKRCTRNEELKQIEFLTSKTPFEWWGVRAIKLKNTNKIPHQI